MVDTQPATHTLMRHLKIILSLTCSLISALWAASYDEQSDALSYKQKKLFSDYMSMPLTDFICMPYSKKIARAYQLALSQQLEFSEIDWHVESSVDLARQLWGFQSEERNAPYGNSLVSVLRNLMQIHQVDPQKAKEVARITSRWVKSRNQKVTDKKYAYTESEEKKNQRKLRKRLQHKRRKELLKAGQGLPLLDYIEIQDPYDTTPDELLEKALQFKHKYVSAQSFRASLLQLYTTLGYDRDQIYYQFRDSRTFKCPTWPEARRRNQIAAEASTAEEPKAVPEETVGIPMHTEMLDPSTSNIWGNYELEDLDLGDLDSSYYQPSESILDEFCPTSLDSEPLSFIGESSSSQYTSFHYSFDFHGS